MPLLMKLLAGNDVPFAISGSTENLDAVSESERLIKVTSPFDFQTHLARIQEWGYCSGLSHF